MSPFDETIIRLFAALREEIRESLLQEVRSEMQSPYMSVAEAADYLRCGVGRIYDMRSAGRLTPVFDSGRALCLRDEVENLVSAAPRRQGR